jgi:hypothetical protein
MGCANYSHISKKQYMYYTTTTIENVKKGDFFKRIVNKQLAKEVYGAEGYCRETKKYTGAAESDISKCIYLKKGTVVAIGFDF